MFGGSEDGAFNQEISDLVGENRVSRRTWQTGTMAGRTFSGEDIAIIRPEEIRRLQERRALVIAENGKPIIARLSRCIDVKTGARLLAGQADLRSAKITMVISSHPENDLSPQPLDVGKMINPTRKGSGARCSHCYSCSPPPFALARRRLPSLSYLRWEEQAQPKYHRRLWVPAPPAPRLPC
jgi:hypothetical protein